MLTDSYLVTRTSQTLYVIMAFTVINISGTVVLITVAPSGATRGGLIVALYLMQAFQACNPATFLMLSRNSAGQTKKSITYALTCTFPSLLSVSILIGRHRLGRR
jgi:hypothetical protein